MDEFRSRQHALTAPRDTGAGAVSRTGAAVSLDERFMAQALAEARLAAKEGEVPIGAVVVYQGEVIARSHNTRETENDPAGHAEFSALCAASRKLGRWRLSGCTVYVTLEPCLMCAGLMVNARIDRCVYGARDPKGGALGSLYELDRDQRLNHRFAVRAGVLEDACSELLSSFFSHMRARRTDADGDGAQEALLRADEARRARDEVARARGDDWSERATPSSRQPELRTLLAIDSFKGCAASAEVGSWVAEGMLRANSAARIRVLPVADGGEGTLDAVASALHATWHRCSAHDPWGHSIEVPYLVADADAGRVAVVEAARVIGLPSSPCTHEAALAATSYGVGEVLRAALGHEVDRVYVGMGGTATSDGGAGMLRALGARVLAGDGRDAAPGLKGLRTVATVDLAPALDALGKTSLIALSDVKSPLVGARGALQVFGPQKGLEHPEGLDAWMLAYGRALDDARRKLGDRAAAASPSRRFRSLLGVPGAGAAGGLGAALLALGASLEPGAAAILDLIGFDEELSWANVVVTGEGRIDAQTAQGKMVATIAERASRRQKPVIAVVGAREEDLDVVYACGVDLVLTVAREPMTVERAMEPEQAHRNLVCAGEAAARACAVRTAR